MLMSLEAQMPDYSPRQNAVLEEALRLLVDGGEKALTTAGVARAANCSKESLYKWFGDRDGLLSAMIGFQASKVRTLDVRPDALTHGALKEHLTVFARDLLDVLSGDVSLALNRLAIGHSARIGASREGSTLGSILQERGRRQIGRRAGALLEAGRKAGLLAFENVDEAYGVFYGLIVSDLHLRMLLGEEPAVLRQGFGQRAEKAVAAFLRLHGTQG
ncbi:TetR/AcrR family transcriptional regulator C-terminal domain-containing protein [Pararhizobium sp.]|uniref:TetR/AcrR family transcriptional regulator C-terminal domain-containing protein n=1 Tax=Pararhizobium sp. TaxID=1977563 RepID=UPI002726D2D2|nr:TetR/AcrR family transcriptional regulator C-terminal domain-containing protein [Pararhizobium sp.]MDO9418757.1 TetR/AcrR family transcriptional regulator C-terminal domain-containing protein [Pararhizobium sp.]